MRNGRLVVALCVFFTLAAEECSLAVIGPKQPLDESFAKSELVVAGKVVRSRVEGEKQVIEAAITETYKGKPAGEKLRVLIDKPELILKDVQADQPVVVRVTGRVASVHVADAFFNAVPVAQEGAVACKIYGKGAADAFAAFPGRTGTLMRIMAEYKAGKSTFLNSVEDKVLSGPVKALGKVDGAGAAALFAADLDGDNAPELIIAGAKEARIFKVAGEKIEDVTTKWIAGEVGRVRAVGDINGDAKPDLIAGQSVLVNTGTSFKAAAGELGLPAGDEVLVSSIIDVDGDGRADLATLTRTGQLIVNQGAAGDQPLGRGTSRELWRNDASPALAAVIAPFGEDGGPAALVARETGLMRFALREGGAPPADFVRLTGEALDLRASGGKLKGPALTLIDANGDGRTDVLLSGEGVAVVLFDRGFGCFFVSSNATASLRGAEGAKPPFAIGGKTRFAAADLHADRFEELLGLAEDGTVHEIGNLRHSGK